MQKSDLFHHKTIKKIREKTDLTYKQKEASVKWLSYLDAGDLEDEKHNYMKFGRVILEDILGFPMDKIGHEKDNVDFSFDNSAGKKVLLLNREMSNTEMMRKLLVMESKDITYDEVRRNKVSKKVEEKLVNGLTTIISDKYSNLTMYDDIRSLEESMAEVTKFKPDVVIDDYIQLVAVSGAVERRFQLERVMNDYKWICKKENC